MEMMLVGDMVVVVTVSVCVAVCVTFCVVVTTDKNDEMTVEPG